MKNFQRVLYALLTQLQENIEPDTRDFMVKWITEIKYKDHQCKRFKTKDHIFYKFVKQYEVEFNTVDIKALLTQETITVPVHPERTPEYASKFLSDLTYPLYLDEHPIVYMYDKLIENKTEMESLGLLIILEFFESIEDKKNLANILEKEQK